MLHALVLAAQALPVGYRSKNTRAEQAVALGLEGAVVDGFGLSDFTMRPAPDFFRRCQADADRIEIGNRVRHVKGARTIQGVPPLPASLTRPLTTPDFSSQFRFWRQPVRTSGPVCGTGSACRSGSFSKFWSGS